MSEHNLAEKMKNKFKLVKKLHRYSITSIIDPAVKIAMQILTLKVMRKCLTDEVSAPVVSLAAQCMEGVQFNWVHYFCREFLANYREAWNDSKTFHYSWLLLSVMLVAWDLPEDSQFPPVEKDLPKAANFASLWATKDVARVTERKLFWVLMEAIICMAINQKSCFH